jgi:hypothetical protein
MTPGLSERLLGERGTQRDYDPPEVTWPEPELEDGADPVLSPPELELELEPELL